MPSSSIGENFNQQILSLVDNMYDPWHKLKRLAKINLVKILYLGYPIEACAIIYPMKYSCYTIYSRVVVPLQGVNSTN